MTNEECEPTLSDLSEKYTQDGLSVRIDIYEDGDGGWILEIVDQYNNSRIFEDSFPTDVAALNEANEALYNEAFGHSISLNNDGSTLVIGASGEDGSGTGVNPLINDNSPGNGAVYLY